MYGLGASDARVCVLERSPTVKDAELKDARFLTISLNHDFVMSAILAFSASHLAWLTNNAETDHLAYHHRGVAIKGLHEAISAFSQRNSEAILAASMILSWQAAEWWV